MFLSVTTVVNIGISYFGIPVCCINYTYIYIYSIFEFDKLYGETYRNYSTRTYLYIIALSFDGRTLRFEKYDVFTF